MSIHPNLIERYQLALEKDPKSQVFAPLSEAYRKMGLIEEAFRICSRGVAFHPNFAGGHIALANVLIQKQQWENAKESLEKAVQLSPENILAYQQLAECCLQLKQAKEALKAFKMVLFFSPNNKRAAVAVQKLESLTADEYEDDVFSMERAKPLGPDQAAETPLKPEPRGQKEPLRIMESRLAAVDAYSARGDFENAWNLLEILERDYPTAKEIKKRKESIAARLRGSESVQSPENEPLLSREDQLREEKLQFLADLKKKIEDEVRLRYQSKNPHV